MIHIGIVVKHILNPGFPSIHKTFQKMEILLEEYKKKLQSTTESISKLKFKDNANPEYLKLTIKAGCYKIMIAELENALTGNLSYNR